MVIVATACLLVSVSGSSWAPSAEALPTAHGGAQQRSASAPVPAPVDWPSFRGPGGAGVADGAELPDDFGVDGASLAWRTPIPGLGHSSPIVWGDRVYVTSAVTSGAPQRFFAELPDAPDSIEDSAVQRWIVMAIDRHTGEVAWERTAVEAVPRTRRLRKGSFANSTPATDGTHVVALLGSQGLFAYDVDGTLLWRVDLGVLDAGWFFDPTFEWGMASSPVIHDGRVIVQVDVHSGSFIAAFDVTDGRELWRTPRAEVSSFSTPAIALGDGGAEIVTNGSRAIRAYDPETGAERWSLAPSSEVAVSAPLFAAGLVFVGSGYLPTQPLYAVRPGGRGDISLPEGRRSSAQIAWAATDAGPLIATPIVVGDYLFVVGRDGTVSCFDAVTGIPIYTESIAEALAPEEDPDPGDEAAARDEQEAEPAAEADPPPADRYTASPVAANGRMYLISERGELAVVEAGPFLEITATYPLGEAVFATPAIAGGTLYVRGIGNLYAFSR